MAYILQSSPKLLRAGSSEKSQLPSNTMTLCAVLGERAAEQRSEQRSSYQVIDQGKTMLMNTFSKPVQSIVPHNERPLRTRLGGMDLSLLIT